jgi:predicted NUDIX family NTP pyrophosphohydrolase
MAKRKSAGILLYRFNGQKLEVFLVHPGGPFWTNKDTGAWSIPKGEFNEEEQPLAAARREFEEETGYTLAGAFLELTPVVQKAGKSIYAWALEGDVDAAGVKCSSYVSVQWPPNSGKWQRVPEVDKGAWFGIDEAKQKINPAQVALIEELMRKVNGEW